MLHLTGRPSDCKSRYAACEGLEDLPHICIYLDISLQPWISPCPYPLFEKQCMETHHMSRLNHAHCQNATVPQGDRAQVASVLPKSDVPVKHAMGADERALISLGYRQEFNREFSLWTTFCVSFSVLGLLPSFASTLWYGMFVLFPFPSSLVATGRRLHPR